MQILNPNFILFKSFSLFIFANFIYKIISENPVNLIFYFAFNTFDFCSLKVHENGTLLFYI